MVRTSVDGFIFVQWLENGRLVCIVLNSLLALQRTPFFVEAVLRGSTDFIQLLNLVLNYLWEFIEAAIVAQDVVLFVILLFQLVYVQMQVRLRRPFNDSAIVVKCIPGSPHLDLGQVAARRIWRVLKRRHNILLTSDGRCRQSLLEWQRLVSICPMECVSSQQVLVQVVRGLHVQLGWHLLLSFSVPIHYVLLVLIHEASSTQSILEYLGLNSCHA